MPKHHLYYGDNLSILQEHIPDEKCQPDLY